MTDLSNGYDDIADNFIACRSPSGQRLVRTWAAKLPAGGMVLDLGCGHGEPLTSCLIARGLNVSAIDASPKMVAAFKARFPKVEISCEAVEESAFYNRKFDGVLSVSLIFLLSETKQENLIQKMAAVLKPDGRLLLSAPQETGDWADNLTGQISRSLGWDEYVRQLSSAGLVLTASHIDKGGSHYYEAVKR